MGRLLHDLRFALRSLRRRPGFTAAAVLTLGLGIGATTAAFSAVDSLILHPLPFPQADRIAYLFMANRSAGVAMTAPEAVVRAWRERAHAFEATTSWTADRLRLTTTAGAVTVPVAYVQADFFRFLRTAPVLGRSFGAQEMTAGGAPVALLGYGEWRTRFGGSRDVLGRTVVLNGRSFTIIGVAPRDADKLDFAGTSAFWLPLRPGIVHSAAASALIGMQAVARLRPGFSDARAEREMTTIAASVPDLPPYLHGWTGKLMRPQDTLGDLRTILWALLGAVALVLLVACANVAGLLLTQLAGRRRELALHAALGAGRGALVRRLLVESGVLALLGGGLGVLLARWGVDAVAALRPESLQELGDVAIRGRALYLAAVLALGTVLLFGLLPAWQGSALDPAAELKAGSRTVAPGRARARSLLIAVEVALSVVLLVGAGLLTRTLLRLSEVDPGFRPAHVAAVRLLLPAERYPEVADKEAFLREVEARARRVPGVQDVAVSLSLPLGYEDFVGQWSAEGRALPPALADESKAFSAVSPGYFRAFGIPLLRGRGFRPEDATAGDHVLVVGERLARALAPDGRVLGLRVRLSSQPAAPWSEIVGVVGDVKTGSLRERTPEYQFYGPLDVAMSPTGEFWLSARATGNPGRLAAALRGVVRAADAQVPVTQATTGAALIRGGLSAARFDSLLLGGFALLALLLAAIGLFGALAYSVQQRTREIGIRLALGAGAGEVRRLVVSQGLVPVALGLLAGLAGSLLGARVLRGLLYGVGPGDPLTLALVTLVIAATALLASYLPVRRATRVDPAEALRSE